MHCKSSFLGTRWPSSIVLLCSRKFLARPTEHLRDRVEYRRRGRGGEGREGESSSYAVTSFLNPSRCPFSCLFVVCRESAVRFLLVQIPRKQRKAGRHSPSHFFFFTELLASVLLVSCHSPWLVGSCVSHLCRPGSSIVLRSLVYYYYYFSPSPGRLSDGLVGRRRLAGTYIIRTYIHPTYNIHQRAIRPSSTYARPSPGGLTESPKGLLSIRELSLSLASCSLFSYLRLHPPFNHGGQQAQPSTAPISS